MEKYEHKLYKIVEDIAEADAVAFAFLNTEKTGFLHYKQPELAPHEIRANILYSGLCHSDSLNGRSKWFPSYYPFAPGHEIIAEVSEVGADVNNFKKGEKVAFGCLRATCGQCKYCSTNKEALCMEVKEEKYTIGVHWGGFSTQLQQPADFFFKLPENLDISRSAPLLCAGNTVYRPIKEYLKKGMKTAVIGVGGLGHLAVQFLSKLGHEVTGITKSLEKKDFILSLGANEVIAASSPHDFLKHNKEFDFVINTLPVMDNFNEYLSLVAPAGFFVQVGIPPTNEDRVSFSINPIVLNEICIVGSLLCSRSDTSEMLELCAKKDIYPIVEEFAFEDFDKALDKLENGKPIFRCIVNCGDYSKKHGLFK